MDTRLFTFIDVAIWLTRNDPEVAGFLMERPGSHQYFVIKFAERASNLRRIR